MITDYSDSICVLSSFKTRTIVNHPQKGGLVLSVNLIVELVYITHYHHSCLGDGLGEFLGPITIKDLK